MDLNAQRHYATRTYSYVMENVNRYVPVTDQWRDE